jgi:hypothetical protein
MFQIMRKILAAGKRNLSLGVIGEFKSRCPNAVCDPSGPDIWGRTPLDPDVGVTANKFWSGARDLNPGPHGPEL